MLKFIWAKPIIFVLFISFICVTDIEASSGIICSADIADGVFDNKFGYTVYIKSELLGEKNLTVVFDKDLSSETSFTRTEELKAFSHTFPFQLTRDHNDTTLTVVVDQDLYLDKVPIRDLYNSTELRLPIKTDNSFTPIDNDISVNTRTTPIQDLPLVPTSTLVPEDAIVDDATSTAKTESMIRLDKSGEYLSIVSVLLPITIVLFMILIIRQINTCR